MTFLLYLVTAAALAALAHFFIRPLSRAAAIVIVALPLLFTGYALVTGGVYGPIDHPYQSPPLSDLKQQFGIGDPHNIAVTDVYAQMFPWRRAVQLSYARGEWPLWNPYMLCGHLLAGAAQPAAYSPFTLLACLLPVAQSFTYSAAIAFLLAALTAFLLARSLGCNEGAALVGAAAWMCSTSMIMYVHTPMGFTWCCAPLVLLAARRVVHAPGFASGLLLAITLALVLLMGHPESVLLPVLVACAIAAREMIRARTFVRPMLTAIAAGIVAACLCAIYLLPLREAMLQSGEYFYKTKYWAHESRGLPPMQVAQNFVQDVFPYLYLRKWTRPELPLPKAESFAVGSVALALALVAIVRRRTWFELALIAVFVAVGIGWGPAANALQHVPLLEITHNERLVFAAALLLSMLAAIGAQELDRRIAPLLVALAVLGAGTWWLTRHVETLPNQWGAHKIAAELAGLAALIVVAWIPRTRFTIPAILALLAAQRVIEDGGAHKTFPARAAYPRIAMFDHLDRREPFRIAGLGTAFIPATSVFYGLEDARGYEALTYFPTAKTFPLWCRHQPVWFNRVDDLTRPFLSFLNVRYAIVDANAEAPPGWHRIAPELLENERTMPRVSIPRVARLGLSDEAALEEMLRESDFRERVWITADQTGERVNGPGTVSIRKRRLGGEYELDANMQGDGWIVVADTAWNGWRAYIDGRRVRPTRANLAFVSVFVPKGSHAVRLVYWPESFVIGRAISGVTLLALVAAIVLRARSA